MLLSHKFTWISRTSSLGRSTLILWTIFVWLTNNFPKKLTRFSLILEIILWRLLEELRHAQHAMLSCYLEKCFYKVRHRNRMTISSINSYRSFYKSPLTSYRSFKLRQSKVFLILLITFVAAIQLIWSSVAPASIRTLPFVRLLCASSLAWYNVALTILPSFSHRHYKLLWSQWHVS